MKITVSYCNSSQNWLFRLLGFVEAKLANCFRLVSCSGGLLIDHLLPRKGTSVPNIMLFKGISAFVQKARGSLYRGISAKKAMSSSSKCNCDNGLIISAFLFPDSAN